MLRIRIRMIRIKYNSNNILDRSFRRKNETRRRVAFYSNLEIFKCNLFVEFG